jgi:hypothetical protein
MADQSLARIEIAYADHRDNRMIIVGGAAWLTMAEQERQFAQLPEEAGSDFIADFHDADGCITKDKCVPAWAVERVMGKPIAELIEAGRRREDELTAELRERFAAESGAAKR